MKNAPPPNQKREFFVGFEYVRAIFFRFFLHKPHLNIGDLDVTFGNGMAAIFLPLFALFSGF
jgi:hypothetical protein